MYAHLKRVDYVLVVSMNAWVCAWDVSNLFERHDSGLKILGNFRGNFIAAVDGQHLLLRRDVQVFVLSDH